eukprot:Skav206454  [mRNA]  locus=scaffold230:125809:127325:- [translate_table: standard]
MIAKFKEGNCRDEMSLTSDNISLLLGALSLVEQLPGVLAAQRDLKKWQQDQVEIVAKNDLICIMKKPAKELNLAQLQVTVQHCPQPWSDEVQQQLPAFLATMATSLVSKASQMEPDQSDLKKHAGLLKQIGSKVEEGHVDQVGKAIALWIDLAASASNLIAANGKLDNIHVGGDASMQTFFDQDGLDKLIAVKALRRSLCKLMGKLGHLKPAIGASPNHLDPLLSLEIPQSVETELQRETIDDICSFGVGKCFEAIEELIEQFKTQIHECRKKKDPDNMEEFVDDHINYFLQWSNKAPHDWHRSVPNDDVTCHSIIKLMTSTIHKISAQDTQKFCKDSWEAGWTKQRFRLDLDLEDLET